MSAPDPMANYVAATVDRAPTLTDEQRDRLATLLRGTDVVATGPGTESIA